MKKIITAIMFVALFLGSLSLAGATPPGTGTVTQITDVALVDTMYMGKQYYVYGVAKDISGDPVPSTACSIYSFIGDQPIDRKLIKVECLEDKECLPASNLPFECYYTTFGDGSILIPFYIDPRLYTSGETYTFKLVCEEIVVSDTATVVGVANEKENGAYPFSCNVENVKINDGTDGTIDYFDENPNKLDTLNISFHLDSFNTTCVREEVGYKIFRDYNGTWLGHSDVKYVTTDVNGTGVISLPIDTSYFVGGVYQIVISADDKQDTANFTANTIRPIMEGYELSAWSVQNISGIFAWIIVLGFLLICLLILWRLLNS